MAQKLEAIRGGGGSVKIGTTGTVSALMTREMESMKASPRTPASKPSRMVAVSIDCGVSTPKRSQTRKPLDEASTSSETSRKPRSYPKSAHRVPMLASDNVSLDRTPSRDKTDKKATNIVEIVDIKCGNPDRAWASPITSRLKKLGFSKLSDGVI